MSPEIIVGHDGVKMMKISDLKHPVQFMLSFLDEDNVYVCIGMLDVDDSVDIKSSDRLETPRTHSKKKSRSHICLYSHDSRTRVYHQVQYEERAVLVHSINAFIATHLRQKIYQY